MKSRIYAHYMAGMALLFSLSAIGGSATALTIGLRPVLTGLESPIFITHAGDERLFIVERQGRVLVLPDRTAVPVPFLDITPLVSTRGEGGLLSIAFHPHHGIPEAPGAGLFWVNYTNRDGDTVIARYAVPPQTPNQADPDSGLILFTITQPYTNHNGGQMQFGPPEGPVQKQYLYIGMGDGGSGGDPDNNGQRDDTLLGKMLRIEPSTDPNPLPPFYTIPPDNPRAAAGMPLGAIWAKGLRNPWRFSFDADTGDLYLPDVGQDRWEEVNFTPASTPGGLNYGWRIMEGRHCFAPPSGCDTSGLEIPVFEYAQSIFPFRCAIIGGYVYRGEFIPALRGRYLYADYCSGEAFTLERIAPMTWENTLLLTSGVQIITFGEDANQELYLGAANGTVYQFIDLDSLLLTQGPLRRGQTARLRVEGAQAGERVGFFFSITGVGEGPCPRGMGGLCLDLLAPRPLGTATADANGTATLTRPIPARLAPGRTVSTQAVIRRGARGNDSIKSNTVTDTVQ